MTPAVTAKMSQCELAAAEQCTDHSYQCLNSGSMADDGVALQPVFQQSHRVHAVLSDLDGCFATTIRSDDSMHVDPLTDCISEISHQYLWGYVRLFLQPQQPSFIARLHEFVHERRGGDEAYGHSSLARGQATCEATSPATARGKPSPVSSSTAVSRCRCSSSKPGSAIR